MSSEIVFFAPEARKPIANLKNRLEVYGEFREGGGEKWTEEELVSAAHEWDFIIVTSRERITSKVITAATKLKAILKIGVGVENIDTIDLEDIEKISLIEKATHEKNYSEKELFELYKRFQFNINQLLNVKDSYKLLKNYEGRALLYQRLILTEDEIQILDLSYKLKESFIKDNIENAFSSELKRVLSKVTQEQVPSNFSSFYNDNLVYQPLKKKNTKINNKIIHQSKLLKYFEEQDDIEKVENDLNKLLKSIKKNKDYNVSIKDLILLESLISDGVVISKKYKNMFNFEQSNIPTDIQLLLSNNETAMVLLRLIEIIGEDDLENLDPDTLYFITSILNKLNLDSIRNKLLLKILPLKI